MLATPEQLAIDDETRHPEHPNRLGRAAYPLDLLSTVVRQIGREARGIGAGLGQNGGDNGGIFDVELALPEALEGHVVIAAEHSITLALGVEHAAGGEARVPDLLRATDNQAAFSGLAAAIQIAVSHPPPLMRVAHFLGHPAAVIDPRRAEKARDVQHIGQPIDANREVALQIVDEILRQIGIGAFVIDIDGEVLRFSHTGHLSFSPSRGYHALLPPRRHPMVRGHQIETTNTAYFRHDYDCEHADMRRLYEQAKIDQWNAATDIDWARPLEGDGGLIADDLVDIHGTKFWDRLSADERVELNRYVTRWRLSTLMHGEHGAMLVCSQLVENVQGQDAKLFQATQVVDEGRHNEVLHRYVALRLDDETYPLAGNVREIFDPLLGTSAWYLKTIGLQLVAETFAVSLFACSPN